SQKTKLLSSNTNHGTLNTTWKYNNRGHLIKLVQAHDTPHQKTTRYSYTPRGERKTITKPDGVILFYTYDPLSRLETITSSARNINYLYHYDTNTAQPTSVDDLISNTTTILSYDPFGNVLQETLANGLTLTSTYDTRGRRKSLTLPDHSLIIYDYTANHLYSVSKYTPNEQLDYTHTYTHYDKSGPLRSAELVGNLGTIHYSIDPLARTTALTSPYFNQIINKIDPCGNIITMHTDQELLTFSYDTLNQLTEEKDHTYSADSLYRRLEKDNISQDPNILNQLDSFYNHDLNGNPIFCYADDATYTYDSFDRLIEITKQGLRLTFTYDPFHRRLSKTTYIDNTATTRLFLYAGQNEIGAATPDGTLTELRILGHSRGAEISAAIAIELNGRLYAPIHDLFGNLTHLIDTTGTIASHQHYTSFGEPLGTTISPWGYSSKRTDPETNLVYFGKRYYDPTHGRWLTPDPSELTDGLNLYQYLFNNPLTSHDLYGLSAFSPLAFDVSPKFINFIYRNNESTCSALENFMAGRTVSENNYYIYRPPSYPQNTRNLPPGMIIHNNGMDTDLDTHLSNLKYISDLAGGVPVHGVHFPKYGGVDNLKIAFNARNTGTNDTIFEIVNKCHSAYQMVGPNGGIMLMNHSLGCLHAFFAIFLLPQEIRNIMYVVNLAPAKFLLMDSGVRTVTNYIGDRDIVHLWDFNGACRAIEDGCFKRLKSVEGTPFPDHGIQSPTFQEAEQQRLFHFTNEFYCQ
ncbi:MAG: RHS repeat-associated core domain-containing protein, partial [Chlamydiota bacterium]